MRSQCLVCLLLAGLAYGQAAQPAKSPAAGAKAEQNTSAVPEKAPEVKVGPDDAVITLKGFCADSTLQGDACKTVITRAQFDKLADALQPGMPPTVRRQLANRYAQILKMSTEAEKRGLDKGPAFEEKMHFARLQILSQELGRVLQEDSVKVSDADIEDYYKKNQPSYEQVTLERIYVPRAKQIAPSAAKPKAGAETGAKNAATTNAEQPPTGEQKKAAEEAMKKVATDLRARAVKGEDPEKLEKEAYAAAGLPGTAPITKMERLRRTALPANHQAVIDLKPGEVSELISDNSGYYIYKMVSKETLSLDAAKPEIIKAISSQRYRDSMQSFQGNVDLNEAYFGPTRNPAMPPPPRGSEAACPRARRPRLNGYGQTNHCRHRRFRQSGPAAITAALGLQGGGHRRHAPDAFPG